MEKYKEDKKIRCKKGRVRRTFYAAAALVYCILFAWFITKNTQLLECISDSLQGIRYILVLKTSTFKHGDIVAIKDHPVSYVKETSFAKRVLGLPGDRIFKSKGCLSLLTGGEIGKKGKSIVTLTQLPLLETTREGKPLTPLSIESVPHGYVFVIGDNPRSFDSRYEEFGLVAREKIFGRGIFTW